MNCDKSKEMSIIIDTNQQMYSVNLVSFHLLNFL